MPNLVALGQTVYAQLEANHPKIGVRWDQAPLEWRAWLTS